MFYVNTCKQCGKPTATFPGRSLVCQPCHNENARAVRAARSDAKRAADAELKRASDRLLNYGMTPEEYDAHVLEQDGKCAICRVDGERLDVDHNHATGEFRGLLCNPCNVRLGYFQKLGSSRYFESHGLIPRVLEYIG